MASTFEAGEKVTVLFFAGKTLDVIVAHDMGEAVLICSPSEFERAHTEGRVPASVEYPKGFIRSCCPSASMKTTVATHPKSVTTCSASTIPLRCSNCRRTPINRIVLRVAVDRIFHEKLPKKSVRFVSLNEGVADLRELLGRLSTKRLGEAAAVEVTSE